MANSLSVNRQEPVACLKGIICDVFPHRSEGGAHRRHKSETQTPIQRHDTDIRVAALKAVLYLPLNHHFEVLVGLSQGGCGCELGKLGDAFAVHPQNSVAGLQTDRDVLQRAHLTGR